MAFLDRDSNRTSPAEEYDTFREKMRQADVKKADLIRQPREESEA